MIYNVAGNYILQCDYCSIDPVTNGASHWTDDKDVPGELRLNSWPEQDLCREEAKDYGWKYDKERNEDICPKCQSAIRNSFQ